MKKFTLQVLSKGFAVALVMLSSSVLADEAQYYVQGGVSGTAIINADGQCAIDGQVFPGARFGTVYNGANEDMGLGFISADGMLLAMVESVAVGKVWVGSESGAFTGSGYAGIRVDNQLLSAASSCAVAEVIPKTKSRFDYAYTPGENSTPAHEDVDVNAGFIGYANMSENCSAAGDGTMCKASRFSGTFNFNSDP